MTSHISTLGCGHKEKGTNESLSLGKLAQRKQPGRSPSPFPHDLTAEFRAAHRARVRRRTCAFLGFVLFCILTGVALGHLAVADRPPWDAMGVVLIAAWGVWSINYLIGRPFGRG